MSRSARSPHEGAKTSLLEMVIRRERIDQASVVHDGKGNAIGERPSFIRATAVECCARAELFDARGQKFDVRCGCEKFKKSGKLCAVSWLAEAVADFRENPVGRDKRAGWLPRKLPGARMEIVRRVQQRDEIDRVGENRSHCFGAP